MHEAAEAEASASKQSRAQASRDERKQAEACVPWAIRTTQSAAHFSEAASAAQWSGREPKRSRAALLTAAPALSSICTSPADAATSPRAHAACHAGVICSSTESGLVRLSSSSWTRTAPPRAIACTSAGRITLSPSRARHELSAASNVRRTREPTGATADEARAHRADQRGHGARWGRWWQSRR